MKTYPETKKQFNAELFKNYKAMRECGFDPDGERPTWSPALKRLPELEKREIVAHYKQMHKFLELAYIFGDCSKGDRQQSWSKWLAKLSKDGIKDPHVFADGFFTVVDATAPYT